MKKRYAAGLALALVGILSGCGQTAADNTMHLAPVEFSAEQDELIRLTGMSTTANKFFLYEFFRQPHRCQRHKDSSLHLARRPVDTVSGT